MQLSEMIKLSRCVLKTIFFKTWNVVTNIFNFNVKKKTFLIYPTVDRSKWPYQYQMNSKFNNFKTIFWNFIRIFIRFCWIDSQSFFLLWMIYSSTYSTDTCSCCRPLGGFKGSQVIVHNILTYIYDYS